MFSSTPNNSNQQNTAMLLKKNTQYWDELAQYHNRKKTDLTNRTTKVQYVEIQAIIISNVILR